MPSLLPLLSLLYFPEPPKAKPAARPPGKQVKKSQPQKATPKKTTKAPPKGVASPLTPRSDEKAEALWQRCVQSHRATSGWRAALEVRRLGEAGSATIPATPSFEEYKRLVEVAKPWVVGKVSGQKGGKVRVALSSPSAPEITRQLVVCSEGGLWELRSDKDGQAVDCLRGGFQPTFAAQLTVPIGMLPEEVSMLIRGEDPLAIWKAKGRLVSLKGSGAGSVEGMPCELVTCLVRELGAESDEPSAVGASPKKAPPGSSLPQHDLRRVTLAVGQADGLLRRVIVESVQWGRYGTASVTSLTQVQARATLPEAEFAFTPPKGVPVRSGASGRLGGGFGNNGGAPAIPSGRALPQAPSKASGSFPQKPPRGPHLEESEEYLDEAGIVDIAEPAMATREFGDRSLLDGRFVTEIFSVSNPTQSTLRLQPPRGSCRCITGAFLSQEAAPELKPGEKLSVKVTIDLAELRPGAVEKALGVSAVQASTSQEGAFPDPVDLALFTLKGNLLPSIRLDRPLVDLGQWRLEGTRPIGKPVEVDVAFDPRLVPVDLVGGVRIDLGQGSAVRAVPVGSASAPAPNAPSISPISPLGRSWPHRRFRFEACEGAAIGPIQAQITFLPPTGVTITSQTEAIWKRGIPVVGNLSGDVSASPAKVECGEVRFRERSGLSNNAGASFEITLTGVSSTSLEGLILATSHPGIVATAISESNAGNSSNPSLVVGTQAIGTALLATPQKKIKITIASSFMREGESRSNIAESVRVTLRNGQVLIVPVLGLAIRE